MKCTNVTYSYPLYDEGITRAECEEILHKYGLHPNFPIYMSRGGCRWCFFRGKSEMKAKYIFNEPEFIKDKQMELYANAMSERKKFYAINIGKGTYQDAENEVKQEIEMWGLEAVKEMYKKISTHQPCGAFCHR